MVRGVGVREAGCGWTTRARKGEKTGVRDEGMARGRKGETEQQAEGTGGRGVGC